VRSGCGFAEAAMGPFYCPADGKVYIDLAFYEELRGRFGANGDFAQAYVIAHEIGHHVQNLLGISDELRQAQEQNPGSANDLSVRLELQADCFAGIWAHTTQKRDLLEAGDVEEALGAAAAVGDDRIQQQSSGSVHPESWTHGSSEQRMRWFRTGLESGDLKSCDTFAAQ
jgi:predicted metalloprotease